MGGVGVDKVDNIYFEDLLETFTSALVQYACQPLSFLLYMTCSTQYTLFYLVLIAIMR